MVTTQKAALVEARKLLRQQAQVADVLAALTPSPHAWTSEDAQQDLHATLLCDPVHGVFPLAPWYRASFIRRLCTMLEEAIAQSHDGDLEVIEPILRELNELLGRATPTADPGELATCFVTFECPVVMPVHGGPDGRPRTQTLATRIAPKENPVGLKLWEAGYVLADALLAHPDLCQGKHVVELGAGVGLLGLVAGYCLGASRVTMTDVDAQVLQFLRANVEANAAAAAAAGAVPVVEVATLDWSAESEYKALLAPTTQTKDNGRVILAADCIYDRAVIPAFVDVLAFALRQPTVPTTTVLVASTMRNPETYAYYEETIKEKGLCMKDMTVPQSAAASSPFYCPNRAAVRLCRIRIKEMK